MNNNNNIKLNAVALLSASLSLVKRMNRALLRFQINTKAVDYSLLPQNFKTKKRIPIWTSMAGSDWLEAFSMIPSSSFLLLMGYEVIANSWWIHDVIVSSLTNDWFLSLHDQHWHANLHGDFRNSILCHSIKAHESILKWSSGLSLVF